MKDCSQWFLRSYLILCLVFTLSNCKLKNQYQSVYPEYESKYNMDKVGIANKRYPMRMLVLHFEPAEYCSPDSNKKSANYATCFAVDDYYNELYRIHSPYLSDTLIKQGDFIKFIPLNMDSLSNREFCRLSEEFIPYRGKKQTRLYNTTKAILFGRIYKL